METQADVLRRVDEQARRVLRTGEDADVRALIRMYDDAIAAIQAEVERTWQRMMDTAPDDPRMRFLDWKHSRETHLMSQVEHRLEQLRGNATATLRAGMLNLYEDQFAWDAYALDEATPPSITVTTRGLTPSAAESITAKPWGGAMFSDRVWVVTGDMVNEIQNALSVSALNGESVDEAVRRLRNLKVLDGNVPPRYALERLARTELLKAMDRAREALYAENENVVDGEDVLATLDDRTCEICAPIDGLELESQEVQDHLDVMDAEDRPPFHPNCRCTTIPRVASWNSLLGTDELPEDLSDFNPTERVIRGPDGKSTFAPRQSFGQWVQAHHGRLAA